MTPAQTFDALAPAYDQLWTQTAIGRLQRDAFWKLAEPYFKNARCVLDLGCGTGEDAHRLRRGVAVTAIDVSPKMVAIARSRGVDARLLAIEELASLESQFDVVMSNFGALNCVADLQKAPLARLVKPGGYLVAGILGRFCLWETIWFAVHGDFKSAVRRWRGRATKRDGLQVFYPTTTRVQRSLSGFKLIARAAIGICVPPSYVHSLPEWMLEAAARIDRRVASKRVFRAIGDHTLLIFERS